MELVEELRHGWGYDQAGDWHGAVADVETVREEGGAEHDDPLASVRGMMWGVLFSVIFFWLPIGTVVILWWKR